MHANPPSLRRPRMMSQETPVKRCCSEFCRDVEALALVRPDYSLKEHPLLILSGAKRVF